MRRKFWNKNYTWWVDDVWRVRGKKLDFDNHKYLTQIYEDQHPNIVYNKSAQVGLTERMITEAMWLPDQFRENSLYLFPTSGTVGDLVQERIDGPIMDSKYLQTVNKKADKISGGKWTNKVGLKRMSKGFIYFRGSNKPTQITSVSADAIFVDEIDRMTQENVPYFDKRTEHSDRKWQRWASTPTIPDFGISKKYYESDQHEWHVKCNHCGKYILLDFWENIKFDVDGGIKNERIECNHCHKVIIPWQLEGQWVKKTDSDVRGYHISQLYSPKFDLRKAIKESLKGDEFSVTQFYNQILGLPYEPKGSKITEEDIQSCIRDYTSPSKEDKSYCGIDVGTYFDIVIIGDSRLLFEGRVKDSDELIRVLKEHQPKSIVIDALPETRKSQEVVDAFKGRAYLCYYAGVEQVKGGEWFKVDKNKVNVNRTVSLDYSGQLIKTQELELPKNISPEFRSHMKNLIRSLVENNDGKETARYVKTGPDHLRHALNYAYIAREIFGKRAQIDVMVL